MGTHAEARPYTLEDMLDLRSLGNVSADPSGRWLMIEVGRPYRDAPRFDNEAEERMVLTQLFQVDLERPGPAKLAFDQSRRAGYISGPFSPGGGSMVVVRNQDHRTTLGVLDVAHRRVRWLGFGAERADFGDTVVWLSDNQLLALAMPDSDRPYRERLYDTAMQRLPVLWRRSARGLGPTDVLMGSGQYRDTHPVDPMRRLVEVDLLTGRSHTLALGPFESLSLSATERMIALVETTGRLQPDPKALMTLGTPWQHRRVRLYDLATDRLSPQVQGLDLQIYGLRWSRTGDRLLAYGVDDRSPEASSELWEIDAKAQARPLSLDGLKLTLVAGVLRPEPRFDWVGQDIVFYAQSAEAKRSDWYRLRVDGPPVLLTGALKAPPPALTAVMDDRLILAADDGLWSVGLNGEARAQSETSGLRLFSPKRLNTTLPLAPDAAPDGSQLAGVRSTAAGFLSGGLKNGLWVNGTVALSSTVQPLAAWREGMAGKVVDAHGVARIFVSSHGRKADVLTLNPQLASVDFVTPITVPHIGHRHIEPIMEHRYGALVEPSGFFALPNSENISAVLVNPQGTLVKFNRLGYVAGFGDRRVRMTRFGFRRRDSDLVDPRPQPFRDDVHAPGYQETWVEGMVVLHNPQARHPLDPALLPGASHEFLQPDGRIMSLIPESPVLFSQTSIQLQGDEGPEAED
jgi:hypothetical protein